MRAPVTDAQVAAVPNGKDESMSVFGAMSRMGSPTDRSGRFTVLGVEPGPVSVSVRDTLGPLAWAGLALARQTGQPSGPHA